MSECRGNKSAVKDAHGYRTKPGVVLSVAILLVVGGLLVLPPTEVCGKEKKPVKTSGVTPKAKSDLDMAFLEAVRAGNLAAVKAKLKAGANINAQDEFGLSALHVVRNVRLAQFLIRQGADVNLRNKDFLMTPLFSQEVPIAKLLVASGADVNARSKKGNTPLIWYTYSNYFEGIKYLLSVGADINARNEDGQTALDVAEEFADQKLVEFFRARMQRPAKGN